MPVTLKTSDRKKIVGDYYSVMQKNAAVLLVHMMPSDRKSYFNFAKKLNENGFSALSIDLRFYINCIVKVWFSVGPAGIQACCFADFRPPTSDLRSLIS